MANLNIPFSMKSADVIAEEKANAATNFAMALRGDDDEKTADAFSQLCNVIKEDTLMQAVALNANGNDEKILSTRGKFIPTTKEKSYFDRVFEAFTSPDPKQALSNVDAIMPETTIEYILGLVKTTHPLLNAIAFKSTNADIKLLVNKNGPQAAVWGALTSAITEELSAAFTEVDAKLAKLTAFIPVSKDLINLGPTWLANYIVEVLAESNALAIEIGIVDGTGKSQPVGMTRDVHEGVTVTGGEYPRKTPIKVESFSPMVYGAIAAQLASDTNGNIRAVNDLILVVNPIDYLTKIMPATTVLKTDGTYQNDILPLPTKIIQSAAMLRNHAVIGIANRYFMAFGGSRSGKIESSDEYKFLEDNRIYTTRFYGFGMALDDNAFKYLDITDLQPANLRVEVTRETGITNCNLSALSIGSLIISPTFDENITEYTATTTNATNTVTATPAETDATVAIMVNNTTLANGAAANWNSGENNVDIYVICADSVKTYHVVVTKS